jgi:hypothetical protein
MKEGNGLFVCEFLISDIPLNREFAILVSMSSNEPTTSTGEWLGGSSPQPPPGQQRTILNPSRTARLTGSQPRARMEFEMVYAPSH